MYRGVAVLLVVLIIHVAWIGRLARDRGRSVLAWGLAGVTAGCCGGALGALVLLRAVDSSTMSIAIVGGLAPFVLALGAMLCVIAVLARRPTHVALRREWKVAAPKDGEGTLVIAPAEIELRWEARTETIARAALRSAVADGECVRVTWDAGEVLLMPMVAPQTRAGRIRQSELIAQLLSR